MKQDLTHQSALALSGQIARGDITCVAVMAAFLDRIEQYNPRLNAIVSIRSRADILADAKRADETPAKGWLQGFPIAIKDLTETKGIRTTFGSPLFENHIPAQDALMVQRIKDAGAIVIGKTNTPEFGLGSHTFNPVHGATRNPYALNRTAGGSSGGAAAALAARLLPVADGSDMMGSLRNPAAFCNVYGFRPSWGLVPNEPQGDVFLHQLSTAGPMGRAPADIAAFLATLAGPDPRLPFAALPPQDLCDLSASVKGKRIAWLGDWNGAYACEDGILRQCEDGLAAFQAIGCTVETVKAPFDAAALWQSWITLRAWANASQKRHLYDDPQKRALLKPTMIWEIEKGMGLSAADVHRASEIRSAWFRAIVALSETYDAFVLPAAQVWPFPVTWTYPETINGAAMDTYHRWMEVVVPVSLIGLPCLAVPAGFGNNGLPMGLQLFGRRGADRDILTLGQAYHLHHDWTAHMPPL